MKKIKAGNRINVIRTEKSPPITVKYNASNPLPSRSILCPGRTASAVESSGAPKKIEGMKSKNVWDIAIAIIATAMKYGFIVKESGINKRLIVFT